MTPPDPKTIELARLARACRGAQRAALTRRGRADAKMDPELKRASIRAEDALDAAAVEYLRGVALPDESPAGWIALTATNMIALQRRFWRSADRTVAGEARDYERRLDALIAEALDPPAPTLFDPPE